MMTEPQLDARGEAHQALSSVVAAYGPPVLSNPRMLGSLVTDLLPDLPRNAACWSPRPRPASQVS